MVLTFFHKLMDLSENICNHLNFRIFVFSVCFVVKYSC
jgi:hypothetical protein